MLRTPLKVQGISPVVTSITVYFSCREKPSPRLWHLRGSRYWVIAQDWNRKAQPLGPIMGHLWCTIFTLELLGRSFKAFLHLYLNLTSFSAQSCFLSLPSISSMLCPSVCFPRTLPGITDTRIGWREQAIRWNLGDGLWTPCWWSTGSLWHKVIVQMGWNTR